MTTTYSPLLRLALPGVGDPASYNQWGALVNEDTNAIEQAITGVVTVDLTGLTTYTLTANNGVADQSRAYAVLFTGTLTAPCAVTVPGSIKFGVAKNTTAQVVTMTTGVGGSAITLPLNANTGSLAATSIPWIPYFCDGTNILSDTYPLRGAILFNTVGSTTTFTVPNGVDYMKWALEATGGVGGAGGAIAGSANGGGGGGGGGYVMALMPVTAGEVFTLNTTAYNVGYFAQLLSAAGDVALVAYPGGNGYPGNDGAQGGYGGLTSSSGTTRVMQLFMNGGVQGSQGWNANGFSVPGPGGASGAGRAGGNTTTIAISTTNSTGQANVTYPGGGGPGGCGFGVAGLGGGVQILGEY